MAKLRRRMMLKLRREMDKNLRGRMLQKLTLGVKPFCREKQPVKGS